ncbi:MAG: hypothetical protein CL927_16370 [Deltaproteobacteria bacterium]|nr:hypothetical protein [Deltaproteobacteria bacterium]HCH62900.1 hypothetical protein [Deltaproteobacteria bacterium]
MKRSLPVTIAATFLLALLGFGLLQAADPRLADYDSWFHIRYAWLLRHRGPWMAFDWMPHTFFAEGWVDHQWLYHLLLIPFTFVDDLRVGAKASAAVFSAGAVAAFAAVLHHRKVAWPVLWAAVLLAGSRFLMVRLMMPRTQALSLAFLLVGWWLATEHRHRALAVVGFFYGWTYHVAAMLVPTALATTLPAQATPLRRRSIVVGVAAAAVAVGLFCTPYMPRSAEYFWLHVVEKVANQRQLEVGAEWFPIQTRLWLLHMAPALAVGIATVAAALVRGTRAERDTLSAGILALGWGLLALWSQKWIEMAVPFGLLFTALLWRDVGIRPHWLLWAPLVAIWNGSQAVDHVRTTVPDHTRLAAIGAMLQADPGPVFHPDWTDFSELFHYAPDCTFTVGLDPTFLAAADPARYRLMNGVLKGQVTDISGASTAAWGAKWVVLTDPTLADIAARDPGLTLHHQDGAATLWRVHPPDTP